MTVNRDFAYLALERVCQIGNGFRMSQANRIREWREVRGLTLEELADRSGISVSYLSRMESGKRNVSLKNLAGISEALGVPARDLVNSEPDILVTTHTVGVVGYISAGGSIDTGDEQHDPTGNLFEITVPFPVPSGAFALQIKGDSMWPRYDPDDIVICSRPSEDPRRLVGFEAAVATPEGARYLKRLLEGRRSGLYDLESHNAPPIRGVRISWASDIYATVRAQHWQRLTDAGRKRAISRAAPAAE